MNDLNYWNKVYNGQIARTLFISGNVKKCREYLLKSNLTYKSIGLYFTSFFPFTRKLVLRKFDIMGVRKFKRHGYPIPGN